MGVNDSIVAHNGVSCYNKNQNNELKGKRGNNRDYK